MWFLSIPDRNFSTTILKFYIHNVNVSWNIHLGFCMFSFSKIFYKVKNLGPFYAFVEDRVRFCRFLYIPQNGKFCAAIRNTLAAAARGKRTLYVRALII